MWKVGDKLGRFLLEKEIGQGSHGVVFVAKDTALDSPIAVKILHPWLTQDTAIRDRFKRELLLARRISHPGVCRLFDLHEEGEAFFITMEFVAGQTLLGVLKSEGRLQALRAVKILRGVAQALAAAHAAGVIHRDLKPANIIVRAGDQPMILDFGTATAGDVSRVTRPGTAVGSMRFIAPEVFTGVAPSTKTDIYALGVVAYVTLAGKLPYNAAAGAIEMLDMIKNQPPQRLDVAQPDVPTSLADAVGQAMAKDPELRFQSALDFDAALARVEVSLEGGPTANFSRWAPAAVVKDALAQVQAAGLPAEPATAPNLPRATISGIDKPGETLVTPVPPEILAAAAAAEQSGFVERTSVAVPELTLGSMPSEDKSGLEGSGELPVVTGALTGASGDAAAAAIGAGVDPPNAPDGDGLPTMDAELLPALEPPAPTGADLLPPPPAEPVQRPVRAIKPGEATVVLARDDVGTMDDDDAALESFTGARTKKRAAVAIIGLALLGVGALAVGLRGGDEVVAAADAGLVSDAGSAAAVVTATWDAGPMAADVPDAAAILTTAPDAGVVAEVDAGAAAFDFAEGEGEAGPDARTPAPRRSPVDDAIRSAKAKMLQKGLIAGDLPTVDALLKRAWSTRSRPADGVGYAREAQRAVEAQAIDRVFVLQKLSRFNSRYQAAKAKNPRLADRVEPLSRAAADAFSRGQFPQANKKLNAAFAALGR